METRTEQQLVIEGFVLAESIGYDAKHFTYDQSKMDKLETILDELGSYEGVMDVVTIKTYHARDIEKAGEIGRRARGYVRDAMDGIRAELFGYGHVDLDR